MRSHRLFAALTALVLSLSALPATAAPLNLPTRTGAEFPVPGPPEVTAASWILYDEAGGAVLASRNADEVRAPASITKIMTVLLALERADQEDIVTVSSRAAATGEREIDLYAGEQVKLGGLLRAAMIHSANDAATAIAEHVGGSVEEFAALMNQRADELDMTSSQFVNPHGLDAAGHQTTARDMLKLVLEAMTMPAFRDIVRSQVVVFPDAPDGSSRRGTTTNLMLGEYEGMSGVKTGFTSRALLTFVATAEREGRRLYAVVLGSDGRRAHFADVEELFDYGFDKLGIYGTLGTGVPYQALKSRVTPSPVAATVSHESMVHLSVQGLLDQDLQPPQTDLPEAPPPIVSTKRVAEAEPGVWSSLVHWLTMWFRP